MERLNILEKGKTESGKSGNLWERPTIHFREGAFLSLSKRKVDKEWYRKICL